MTTLAWPTQAGGLKSDEHNAYRLLSRPILSLSLSSVRLAVHPLNVTQPDEAEEPETIRAKSVSPPAASAELSLLLNTKVDK